MARLHGRKGEISISANTSPEGSPADLDFTAIGSLSGWSVSFAKPPLESTSLRSAGKTYLVGLEDVSGGFEGTFDTDVIETLMTAADDSSGVWIRITPSTDYPEIFFQGSARTNLSMAGTVNDAIKVSGSFVGNGVWQKSFRA